MRRFTKLVLPIAALVFVIAWLTPVVDGGTTLAEGGVPGWEAFRVSLSPVWPYEGLEVSTWYWGILTVASALTNFVFLAALAHVVWRPGTQRRAIAWSLTVAFAVDCSWLFTGDLEYLRLGYYLWVASFALLAVAAWRVPARGTSEASATG